MGSGETFQGLLARARSRAALPFLAAGVILLVAILVAGHELNHHLQAVEAWIGHLGSWGPVVFVGLFAVGTSLLLPESAFSIIAGVLFGLRWGLAAAASGNLAGSALQYVLARWLLRARIQRALAARPSLAAIQRAVVHDNLRLQVLLRLAPLNPATISYLLGAAGVRFSRFLIACLALAPHLFIEVFFGHAGRHTARLVSSHTRSAHLYDLVLIGGLAVGITLLVLLSKSALRSVMRAVAEAAADDTDAGTARGDL